MGFNFAGFRSLGVKCYMPANGETVSIKSVGNVPVDMSLGFLTRKHGASEFGISYSPHQISRM